MMLVAADRTLMLLQCQSAFTSPLWRRFRSPELWLIRLDAGIGERESMRQFGREIAS